MDHKGDWSQEIFQKFFFFNFIIIFKNYFLVTLHGVWDLSSPTRDPTHTPCIGSVES